jgi:hypothetical protein
VTQLLKDCDLVVEVAPLNPGTSAQFLPSLPPDQITLQEVLNCLGQARGEALAQALHGEPPLAALLQRLLEAASPSEWQSLTLQELVNLVGKEAFTTEV